MIARSEPPACIAGLSIDAARPIEEGMAPIRRDPDSSFDPQRHLSETLAAVGRAQREHAYATAHSLLEHACEALLELDFKEVCRSSVAELSERLAVPDRIRTLAKLVLAQAQLALAEEHWEEADRLQTRAMSLVAAADARGGHTGFSAHP